MNAKQALLVATAALVATSGYAVEATQFVPEAPHAVRAEVKAELAQAKADGSFVAARETYGQTTIPARGERDRAEVRAEARMAARNHTPNSLYFGG